MFYRKVSAEYVLFTYSKHSQLFLLKCETANSFNTNMNLLPSSILNDQVGNHGEAGSLLELTAFMQHESDSKKQAVKMDLIFHGENAVSVLRQFSHG